MQFITRGGTPYRECLVTGFLSRISVLLVSFVLYLLFSSVVSSLAGRAREMGGTPNSDYVSFGKAVADGTSKKGEFLNELVVSEKPTTQGRNGPSVSGNR